MEISSRTPEGWPNRCPICGQSIDITPSPGTLDAPCPNCGYLLWFADPGLSTSQFLTSGDGPNDLPIDSDVVRAIPESLARECLVFPLSESGQSLVVAVALPFATSTIEKLRFILNRPLLIVPVRREWIDEQYKKYFESQQDGGEPK
jgi:hypothetical protein